MSPLARCAGLVVSLALGGFSGGATAQEERPPMPAAPPGEAERPPTVKILPERVEEAVGTWDLSQQGANRRCTLTLSRENGRNGRALRFPAGCRRALPVLGTIAGWLFLESGIRFVDENVRPVLLFTPSTDRASLSARAEGGQTYHLVPLQTMGMLPPGVAGEATAGVPGGAQPGTQMGGLGGADAAAIPDVAGARGIPGAEPVLPADVLRPARRVADGAPEPGTYALDRFGERDVCRIELAPLRAGARPDKEVAEVRILPGCRDNGVAVFDPIAWRFANGHITLKARKGHAINLVATRDGAWRRDPDTGITFVLRRVE